MFLGDRSRAGRTFQQAPDGPFPSMTVGRFMKESMPPGPFHDILALLAQANLLQIMKGAACNARCEASVLPVVAPDAGSRRVTGISLEGGLPRVEAPDESTTRSGPYQ